MDRRDFIATGLSSLVTCTCSYARRAAAKSVVRGCRVSAGGEEEWADMRELLRSSSGEKGMDRRCNGHAKKLSEYFGVRPGFSFYEEGPDEDKNALAIPHPFFPEQGPDGTVMLGIHLTWHLARAGDFFRILEAHGDRSKCSQPDARQPVWRASSPLSLFPCA